MAVIWKKTKGETSYKVTKAGSAVRLYRNNVLHSQWNENNPISGKLWDLFLLSSLNSEKSIDKVLVLGAGGGAVINLIHCLFPKCHVDAIDLDKTHLYVARKYFKVSKKYCRLIHDDVKNWLPNNENKQYDLIIDDVFFESNNIPYRSVKVQAIWIEKLLKKLTKQGVLVINFADNKEWNKSRKKLANRRLVNQYKFAISSHSTCDNKVVHIAKKQLSKKIIKQRFDSAICQRYMKILNNGKISYKKLLKLSP